MTRDELKSIINSKPYDFLRTNEHLGEHLMYLTIGGSHAYGTNQEGSDIDIRGVALNSKSDLLGITEFEHYVDNTTDTTVFSFKKAVKLICSGNPNMLEQLGNADDLVISYNPVTKMLMDNKNLFLSKHIFYPFGGFAWQMIDRSKKLYSILDNKDSEKKEKFKKKIDKDVMNAVRLYYMAFDILERGEIKTYRGEEVDLLQKIRNGQYDFDELIDHVIPTYEKRLNVAKNESALPDWVDMNKVNELVMTINEEALKV